jgi:hypothetical protein
MKNFYKQIIFITFLAIGAGGCFSFMYSQTSNPEREFLEGNTYVFKTKGTDWQLEIPNSWKASEANRPNIIQKFYSDDSHKGA